MNNASLHRHGYRAGKTGSRIGLQPSQRRGVVLFLVVTVVLLMSVIAYAFLISMRDANLATAAAGDQMQSRQNAFSVRERVASWLESSQERRNQFDDGERGWIPIKLLDEEDGGEYGHAVAIASINEPIRFGTSDESAKLHLATLLQWDAQNPGSAREALMNLPNMTESIADHLLDWVDADDQPREFGNESSFYVERFGYPCRNGLPPLLEELQMIPEINPQQLLGSRRELFEFEAEEPDSPGDQGTSAASTIRVGRDPAESDETVQPWSQFLTVHARERNESWDGTPRLFVNDSDLQTLHANLVSEFNLEIANLIILYRQFGPPDDEPKSDSPVVASGSQVMDAGSVTIDFSLPARYSIRSLFELVDLRIKLEPSDSASDSKSNDSKSNDSGDQPTLVEGPLRSEELSASTDSERLFDRLTVSNSPTLVGRVNIQSAPREVLLGVPGIDLETAEQILGSRDADSENRKTVFWLLREQIVDFQTLQEIYPLTTTTGDVHRCIVAGVSANFGTPVAFEVLLDASGDQTRQKWMRPLTQPGRLIRRLPVPTPLNDE